MRLFFLPISTRRAVLYCQRTDLVPAERKTILDRVTTQAATLWAKWEKSDRAWQKKIVEYGNKALRRIPHEEWGLKSIPPRRKVDEQAAQKQQQQKEVEVAFPSTVVSSKLVLESLRKLAVERRPFHWKWLWWSIAGMPVAAPVGLIPIIPNIPFFYLVFRAWSHWRAFSGSKHLGYLLEQSRLTPTSSSHLEELYRPQVQQLQAEGRVEARPRTESPSDDTIVLAKHLEGDRGEETLLLQLSDGRRCADVLGVPEITIEVERAIEQVQIALDEVKQNSSG